MNDLDLDRLFRSAARAGREIQTEPPFGFATRVAAVWRSGPSREGFMAQMLWFRRALLCACAVAVISVGWSALQGESGSDDLTLASYDTASVELP